jgi:hypothetical protein
MRTTHRRYCVFFLLFPFSANRRFAALAQRCRAGDGVSCPGRQYLRPPGADRDRLCRCRNWSFNAAFVVAGALVLVGAAAALALVRGTLGEHVRPSRASPRLVSRGSRRSTTGADRTHSPAPCSHDPQRLLTISYAIRNSLTGRLEVTFPKAFLSSARDVSKIAYKVYRWPKQGRISMNGRSMPEIRVNDAELFYVDQGAGVPVVFVHGAWMDRRYWEPQRDEVAARYRFIAYSLRYHGTAPWPDDGKHYSTATHLADLTATLVVGGANSPRYLSLINDVIVQGIPSSRLVVITKAAHLMSYQNPGGLQRSAP